MRVLRLAGWCWLLIAASLFVGVPYAFAAHPEIEGDTDISEPQNIAGAPRHGDATGTDEDEHAEEEAASTEEMDEHDIVNAPELSHAICLAFRKATEG